MEKRKLSGKTILKLTGALLALVYFGFCLYAGITGKFPGMHRKQHVMRFGDLKNWVSGGMSAVMIAVFCINSAINDLNLQKKRKKSSTPFFHYVTAAKPSFASGVLSGYWMDRNCPLCRNCSVPVWDCVDSADSESMDFPPAFA